MSFYLLEIQHEEIPAGFIGIATEYLKTAFEREFTNQNISFDTVISDGTPRRLSVYISGISDKQANKDEEIIGPPSAIAFDINSSNLTDVGRKFVESKGIDITTVIKKSTPKGDYLLGIKKSIGAVTTDILKTLVPDIIRNIPFAKSMRWSDIDYKFARPIHHLLSIYNSEIIEFEIAKVKSSNITVGHRFLAPDKFTVTDYDDYIKKLKSAFVILKYTDRLKMIEDDIKSVATKNNYKLIGYETLLQTVANLVEYPTVIIGEFDKSYLNLPKEVLVTSMKVHQKFFPLFSMNEEITNKFLGITNTFSDDNSQIKLGYERVLKARLYDALFFYNNDKSTKLIAMAEKLKAVTYQEKLGTSYDKVERFTKIAIYLADLFAKDKIDDIKTICKISKADLMSEMVYEFPELQGVMGSYYATHEGFAKNIAVAIKEHYEPCFAGDKLPTSIEAKIISIADKIDTITAIFVINMIPTGNLDPYALRRSAIGILNILIDAKLSISLKDLISHSLDNFISIHKFNKEETLKKVLTFIIQRFKQVATKYNIDTETFDALSSRYDDPITLINIATVLNSMHGSSEFITIVKSFKRINNILKKNNHTATDYDKSLLNTKEEKDLITAIDSTQVYTFMKDKNYQQTLKEILIFAPLIDKFFDNVMVMDNDLAIRNSRLSLITKLREIFNIIADLDSFAIQN